MPETPSTIADYRVDLGIFCGPLDLLVYLVRKNEIDSVKIQLAKITKQFSEFVEVLRIIDLDLVGDFLVMASVLLEMKSRMVLPQVEDDEVVEELDTEQSGGNLIQQLLEYKKYKDAARLLEERAAEWQERFPRLTNDRIGVGKDPSSDLIKEVELWDLVSAFSRIVQKRVVDEATQVKYDETPIGVYQDRIRDRLKTEERVAFSSFFEGEKLQSRIVGIFLAILELVRHHGFRCEQPVEYGEIWVLSPRQPQLAIAG